LKLLLNGIRRYSVNEVRLGKHVCQVISHSETAEGIFLLFMRGRDLARLSRPGQFIHIRTGSGWVPLWRRPFSVHGADPENESVQIVYRVVGPGTEALSMAKPGDVLDVLGPLGRGFDLDKTFTRGLLVAGGVGSADLFFLAEHLLKRKKQVLFLWGVRRKSELFGVASLREKGIDVRISSEDGSDGRKGLVTDLLKETLADKEWTAEGTEGFLCGPKGMIKEVQRVAEKTHFSWQVSMEEKMACGVNACKGCAVKMKNGGYRMACSDGPVFDLREVVLDG
jgi:dihydroorotate dehydrogenase electron transfer subunit